MKRLKRTRRQQQKLQRTNTKKKGLTVVKEKWRDQNKNLPNSQDNCLSRMNSRKMMLKEKEEKEEKEVTAEGKEMIEKTIEEMTEEISEIEDRTNIKPEIGTKAETDKKAGTTDTTTDKTELIEEVDLQAIGTIANGRIGETDKDTQEKTKKGNSSKRNITRTIGAAEVKQAMQTTRDLKVRESTNPTEAGLKGSLTIREVASTQENKES